MANAARVLRARLRHQVGPLYYSLYRFSDIPEQEWDAYLTDSGDFRRSLRKASPESVRKICRDKLQFHEHCRQHDLPTIPVLGLIGASDGLSPAVPRINSLQQWKMLLDKAPSALFIKPVDGKHGLGGITVNRTPEGFVYEERTGTADSLFEHLNSKLRHENGLLIQPRLTSAASLSEIVAPGSLSTIRVVTRMEDGQAVLVAAGMKLTTGDNTADNFARGSTGNLLAGIDMTTGALMSAWGSADRNWPVIRKYLLHPDTGQEFEGFKLQFWKDMVDLALRAQHSLPDLKSAGWDIAATDSGLVIVEVNDRYEIAVLQIAHQRGMKRDFSYVWEGGREISR